MDANDKVAVIPSFVVCIAGRCNMRCVYCPPNGEDIMPCSTLCEIETVLSLLDISHAMGVTMVRITGGEPLLEVERTQQALDRAVRLGFVRLVLNTSGIKLAENVNWLSEYASKFECKVSLDTLNREVYRQITNIDALDSVLKGIGLAAQQGIKIVINCVVSKLNVENVLDVVRFCDQNRFDLKLFDISNFGGTFHDRWVKYYQPIDNLIRLVEENYERNPDERLIGGRGRKMASFRLRYGGKLFIINHHGSRTSNLLYSDECLSCPNHPCASGRLCITLRSDGLLSVCRLRPDLGVGVSGFSKNHLKSVFADMMNKFGSLHFEWAKSKIPIS